MDHLRRLLNDHAQNIAKLQQRIDIINTSVPSQNQDLSLLWQDSPNIEKTRRSFLETGQQVQDLLSSPLDRQQQVWENLVQISCLRVVLEHEVPSRIPTHNPISFTDLASIVDLPRNPLVRVIRYLMTYKIFCEPSLGYVAHTAPSMSLCDDTIKGSLGAITEMFLPVYTQLSQALGQHGGSQEWNATAFNLANNTKLPAFQFFDGNERRNQQFTALMTIQSRTLPLRIQFIVEGLPWADHKGATVIDVG